MRRARIAIAIAAMMGAGLIYFSHRHDMVRAGEALQGRSLVADLPSGAVEYASTGDGPVLLAIHGAGGGFDQGLAISQGLIGWDFRIIAPSRFGYLRSPVPHDVSPQAQAEHLVALLSELGTGKVIVMGVSAGALSAIEIAIKYPERVAALILIVPATFSPATRVSIEPGFANRLVFWMVNNGADFIWWAAERIAPSTLVRFLGSQPELLAGASAEEQHRIMSMVGSIQPLSRRFAGISIDSNTALVERPLEKISVPTLVVSAKDDLFNTLPAARYAAQRIPSSELVEFDTGGHLLIGHASEIRARTRMFLARVSE